MQAEISEQDRNFWEKIIKDPEENPLKNIGEMVFKPVPFSQERMGEALAHPKIKAITVMQMKVGMEISIDGQVYEVLGIKRNNVRLGIAK